MSDPLAPVLPPDSAEYRTAAAVQSRAADPKHSAFVMANAGSGKTKVLIDRVARLLLRREDGRPGAPPDSILCITYTKAAASEMLTRLFKTLGAWSVMDDAPLRQKLAVLQDRNIESYRPEDLAKARALFASALETPGGLRIETIHAFCARVLRRFPLEAGVFPGFSEIEEDEARLLWHRARGDAVLAAQTTAAEHLDLLSREGGHEGAMVALDALKGLSVDVLRFAAHHAGDFGAMDQSLRDRLQAPENSAADLIAFAMMEGLPVDAFRQAADVLSSGKKTDADTAATLYALLETRDASVRWAQYQSIFQTQKGDLRGKNPYTKDSAALLPLIEQMFQTVGGMGDETLKFLDLKEKVIRAEAFERTSAMIRVGLPALEAYRQMKRERAALDFDDLIEHTRRLLTESGMADWVLYKLDGGLTHVLLDEAQDTSPPQWELIRALTGEFDAGQGVERAQDPRTLFVVGDEKQSIYSFQGADPSQLLAQFQSFHGRNPDLLRESMEMSFRSGPEILTYVDEVWNGAPPIPNAPAPQPPDTADIVRHMARRSNQPGCVDLWPLVEKEPEKDDDAWARPVNAMRSSSPEAKLARKVAEAVRGMIDAHETVWVETADGKWKRRAIRAEDVLILVRGRTGGLFDAIISALKAEGLPVAGADRLRLSDHIGVQDCLNLMRFAALPERDLTLAEILRGPFCGLVDDDRYLFELARGKRRPPLWQRVQASDDPDVRDAAAFLRGLIDRAHLPPFEFLSATLDLPGADGWTGWEKLNARLGEPARDPVEALVAEALGFDATEPASLQSFIARMEAGEVEIKRDLAAPEGEVRVMTVHGAKGLQAPVVILPDTTSAPKPSGGKIHQIHDAPVWSPRRESELPEVTAARVLADAKAIEEHRRLLYVALTRAQDRLIIGGAWHGGPTGNGYAPGSWYDLCLAAMNVLSPPSGDKEAERRFGSQPPTAPPEAGQNQADTILPAWTLQPVTDDTGVRRRFSAPTSLLGRDMPVMAPFGEGREARLKRGRMIHALLQYLPDLPQDDRAAAGRNFLARDTSLTDEARREMLDAAMGVLNAPEMAGVFAPGGRAEAAIIGSSPRLPEGVVINGRVDRLVITPDEVLIVDFKTDQPAPDDVSGVGLSYLLQMAAYWAVLKEAYDTRTVRAALCWTDGPRLMPLPEDLLIDSLKRADSEV
ncbi:double-strand break repair helicase AddA [Hyphomonas sp.]|uniref:double-strand break repair helicase AddA n=1 Tax=Hyphomonas sp. TaxID=87 RepID=UPI003529C0E6